MVLMCPKQIQDEKLKNHNNIEIQVMLLWLILPFCDFCCFRSVAVNSAYINCSFFYIYSLLKLTVHLSGVTELYNVCVNKYETNKLQKNVGSKSVVARLCAVGVTWLIRLNDWTTLAVIPVSVFLSILSYTWKCHCHRKTLVSKKMGSQVPQIKSTTISQISIGTSLRFEFQKTVRKTCRRCAYKWVTNRWTDRVRNKQTY